ncbi:hypothetical protein ScalyP_jg548 [Parmales sp. scaly parma]|nr:hypothetical protein ScalyP_jg548 [Parmales sp. scaly parma]
MHLPRINSMGGMSMSSGGYDSLNEDNLISDALMRSCFWDLQFQKCMTITSLDGLLTGCCLVSAGLGAELPLSTILAVVIACGLADSLCISIGSMLTHKRLTDDVLDDRSNARFHLLNYKRTTKDTLIDMYIDRGMSNSDATRVVDVLASYPKLFVDAMLGEDHHGTDHGSEQELADPNIYPTDPDPESQTTTTTKSQKSSVIPWLQQILSSDALLTLFSFSIFCSFPVGALYLTSSNIACTVGICSLMCFILGAIKSKFYTLRPHVCGLESVSLLAISTTLSYLISSLIIKEIG